MPMWCAWAAATSAVESPGQLPVVGRYRPQKSGVPRLEMTCGKRPVVPAGSCVYAAQESTPHMIRVGATAADLACSSDFDVLRRTFCSTPESGPDAESPASTLLAMVA